MTSESAFNLLVPPNIFQEKQLTVKSGSNVCRSRSSVIPVTASCEIRPYVPRVAEMISETGSHPW
jgi:hypothetical protein